jgi:hypothetical protein
MGKFPRLVRKNTRAVATDGGIPAIANRIAITGNAPSGPHATFTSTTLGFAAGDFGR